MESLPLNSETGNNINVIQHFFDSFEHLKKPVLRSLAIAHGSPDRVSEMAICHQMIYVRVSLVHVGLGKCSSSNTSYQGCHSVREPVHGPVHERSGSNRGSEPNLRITSIRSGDSLEDSIPTGKIPFLKAFTSFKP